MVTGYTLYIYIYIYNYIYIHKFCHTYVHKCVHAQHTHKHIYMCKYLHSHSPHTTHPPPLPHPPGVAHKRFPSSVLFQFLRLVVWYISLIIDSEDSTEWRTSNQVWSCTYIYIKMYICIITKTDRHSNAVQLHIIICVYI